MVPQVHPRFDRRTRVRRERKRERKGKKTKKEKRCGGEKFTSFAREFSLAINSAEKQVGRRKSRELYIRYFESAKKVGFARVFPPPPPPPPIDSRMQRRVINRSHESHLPFAYGKKEPRSLAYLSRSRKVWINSNQTQRCVVRKKRGSAIGNFYNRFFPVLSLLCTTRTTEKQI